MNLLDFKKHIESFDRGTVFKFGVSNPFSWRGAYNEVAFAIIQEPMSRAEILKRIKLAYSKTFYGYKGGEFKYDDLTPVNFEEEGYRNYSGGEYCAKLIAELEGDTPILSQEERLVRLAFPSPQPRSNHERD